MVLLPLSEVLRNPSSLEQLGLLPAGSEAVRFVSAHLSQAHLLVYGVLVVIMILFAPDGLLGVWRGLLARLRRLTTRPAAPPAAASP
ncbi:MAG: hypothetical protein QM767_05080 [Anaeromyxobacter sp.]